MTLNVTRADRIDIAWHCTISSSSVAAADDGREPAGGAEAAVAVRRGSVVDFEMHRSLLRHMTAGWLPFDRHWTNVAFHWCFSRWRGWMVSSRAFSATRDDGPVTHYLRHGSSDAGSGRARGQAVRYDCHDCQTRLSDAGSGGARVQAMRHAVGLPGYHRTLRQLHPSRFDKALAATYSEHTHQTWISCP